MRELDLHYLDELQQEMHKHMFFLQDIISVFGEIKATSDNHYDAEEHLHDFVFFCITKAARSIEATDNLLTEMFPEDALNIARSTYECYLHLSYIQINENKIDDFVSLKILAYAKPEYRPKTKKGSPIYGKIIEPVTQVVKDVGLSLIKLSKNTGEPYDEHIHTGFYSLLSEFSHVHMIASSSYRSKDEKYFSHKTNYQNSYQSVIWSLYCSWLIIDTIKKLRFITDEYRSYANELSEDGSKLLIEVMSLIDFDVSILPLQNKLLCRLKHECN